MNSENPRPSRLIWLQAAILGIVLAAPLAIVTYLLNPEVYTATEFVRVASREHRMVFENREIAPPDPTSYSKFTSTQRQLLLHPLLLNKALKEAKVDSSNLIKRHSDPIAWLQKNIEVKFPEGSEIMTVSLTLQDPVVAHQLVRSVVNSYMADVVEKEQLERRSRVDGLERILEQAEGNLRKKRSELTTLADLSGSYDERETIAHRILWQKIALLLPELQKTEIELFHLKNDDDRQDASETRKLEKLRDFLQDDLRSLETEARKFGRRSIDVEMMQREIATHDQIVDRVRQETLESKIELNSSLRIIAFQSAGVPQEGHSEERIPTTILAGLLGLATGVLFVIWREAIRATHLKASITS
jgi:uncharacterized protein involved in exopolysaccharide biosynthesis